MAEFELKWNLYTPVVPVKVTSAEHIVLGKLNWKVSFFPFQNPKAFPHFATFIFDDLGGGGALKFTGCIPPKLQNNNKHGLSINIHHCINILPQYDQTATGLVSGSMGFLLLFGDFPLVTFGDCATSRATVSALCFTAFLLTL